MKKISILGFISLTILISRGNSQGFQNKIDKLTLLAPCIFKGQILAAHTGIIDEDNLDSFAIIKVTQVLKTPRHLLEPGMQVTLKFKNLVNIRSRSTLLFFANPYSFGEELGLKEVATYNDRSTEYRDKNLSIQIHETQEGISDEKLKERIKAAPLIVYGKVNKIHEVRVQKRGLSEHDPRWKDAEIEVVEVIKGALTTKSVKICFASSDDNLYFNSPKFSVGNTGIFIVQNMNPITAIIVKNRLVILDKSNYIPGNKLLSKIRALNNSIH